MIILEKEDVPAILNTKGDAWRTEFLEALAAHNVSNSTRYRYRHPDIKEAVKRETFGKCAYCETLILHAQPGDIDHILPVSKFPAKIVDWANLTMVCRTCNTRKGSFYDEKTPLVNPYMDNPADYLLMLGSVVLPRPGSQRGATTVNVLGLSRGELCERRQERLERLAPLVHQWALMPLGDAKDYVRGMLLEEAHPPAEYSAAVRAYLQQVPGLREHLSEPDNETEPKLVVVQE